MPASGSFQRRGEAARFVAAGVLLAQWFLLLAFSTSDRLHHAVCDDAKQPNHNCAFVAVAKGQLVAAGDFPSATAPPLLTLAWSPGALSSFCPVADVRLMPDRGPPLPLLL